MVLTEYSTATGTFPSVASSILEKLDVEHSPAKLTLVHDRYLFHYLIDGSDLGGDHLSKKRDKGKSSTIDKQQQQPQPQQPQQPLVFLCMTTDESLGRALPFLFLDEVQQRFRQTYATRAALVQSALPFGLNEFRKVLEDRMRSYSSSTAEEEERRGDSEGSSLLPSRSSKEEEDKLQRVQGELDQVKGVMVQNIERVLERGERIEILVDKTEHLHQTAIQFRKRTTQLKTKMWWKSKRWYVIVVLVAITIGYLVVGAVCGLPGWGKCMA